MENIAYGALGGALGAALVVLGVIAIQFPAALAWFEAHPGAAGWFQAFGAIAALLTAICIPLISAAEARRRLRITAYQLCAEAHTGISLYLERVSARQPAWTASEDPDDSLARAASALAAFPATELAVLGGLRSFISFGVLFRRAQDMLPQITAAQITRRRSTQGYTMGDAEFLLEDLGIALGELRKDLRLPRVSGAGRR